MNLDRSFTRKVSNYHGWIQDLEYSSSGCNQIRFDFFLSWSQSRKNLADLKNSLHAKNISMSLGSSPYLFIFLYCRHDLHQESVKVNGHSQESEFWLSSNAEDSLCNGWATVKCTDRCSVSSDAWWKMLFSRDEWDWEGTGKTSHGFPKRTEWSGSLLPTVICRFIEEAWELCPIESLQDRKEQDECNIPNHDGIDKAIVVFF